MTRKCYAREWRLVRGLTQRQVADATGIKISTLSMLENGWTRRPHRTTLLLVSRALSVNPLDLYVRPGAFKGANDGHQRTGGRRI